MRWTLERVLLALAVGGMLALVIGGFAAVRLRPCQYEDSTWCYWDAGARGNGQGHSFISLGGER